MRFSKIQKYPECPARITFLCSRDSIAKEKFPEAMKSDKLRFQFDGAIRTLVQKGEEAEVYVRMVRNPLTDIKDAHFFLSEHGNYHIGDHTGERFTHRDIYKYNLGNYSYYQDEYYFLAIKKLYEENGLETYELLVTKKKPSNEKRAQQD
ncbi:MAG: hypothetical protein IKR04_03235 [Clostridia bacterium]|nr:hypothetical protein [Clostridia bacterium]